MKTTIDGLLDRRVTLEQPEDGYRVAIDTVFLSAAVSAHAGDKIIEFGCGVGGAMLCLTCRVPGVAITGIEIQSELVELARANIARNNFQADMNIQQGDVTALPKELQGRFDHVMINPPYHDEARHDVSTHTGKRTANTEKDGDLAQWIEAAARALKSSGMLTLIHRADRQDEILAVVQKLFGETRVLPLMSKADTTPKRIVIQASKQGHGIKTCQPLTLHNPEGGYSDAAEAVLRHMQPLDLSAMT